MRRTMRGHANRSVSLSDGQLWSSAWPVSFYDQLSAMDRLTDMASATTNIYENCRSFQRLSSSASSSSSSSSVSSSSNDVAGAGTPSACRFDEVKAGLFGRRCDQRSRRHAAGNKTGPVVTCTTDIRCDKSLSNGPFDDSITDYTIASHFTCDIDMAVLRAIYRQLDMCCFYHGRLAALDASRLLRDSAVGTFLLRDSSNPRFLFSLSVRTGRGPTAVRIAYTNGLFRLDQDPALPRHLPAFDSVVKLVSHYRRISSMPASNGCVFLESDGRKDTPIVLRGACLHTTPTLMHACRKVINASVSNATKHCQLLLSDELKMYLLEYPYDV